MTIKIKPGFSIYLDFLRFGAALVVLISHIWPLLFPNFRLPWPGHEAVVIFFVISGYVIAYATFRHGMTFKRYVAHRAVRILSVSIPAILLSIAIFPSVAGGEKIPYVENMSPSISEIWKSTWISLLFLGESWTNNIRPAFNGPYWSLSFEVWYYIIFAAAVFTPLRWRGLAVVIAMCIAGPKILALFPIWLMGVWLYRSNVQFSERAAALIFFASGVCAFAFFWLGFSHILRNYFSSLFPDAINALHGANQFAGDIILGIIITLHFAAARTFSEKFTLLLRFQKIIRYLSSFTLSTYLFHLPLTVFIWNGLGIHSPLLFTIVLFLGIFSFGSITERRNIYYRDFAKRGEIFLRARLNFI